MADIEFLPVPFLQSSGVKRRIIAGIKDLEKLKP